MMSTLREVYKLEHTFDPLPLSTSTLSTLQHKLDTHKYTTINDDYKNSDIQGVSNPETKLTKSGEPGRRFQEVKFELYQL